jgi:hypothetical protein
MGELTCKAVATWLQELTLDNGQTKGQRPWNGWEEKKATMYVGHGSPPNVFFVIVVVVSYK